MKQPNNAVESSNKKHNGIIGFWKFMIYVLHINFTIPLRRKNGEKGIL